MEADDNSYSKEKEREYLGGFNRKELSALSKSIFSTKQKSDDEKRIKEELRKKQEEEEMAEEGNLNLCVHLLNYIILTDELQFKSEISKPSSYFFTNNVRKINQRRAKRVAQKLKTEPDAGSLAFVFHSTDLDDECFKILLDGLK